MHSVFFLINIDVSVKISTLSHLDYVDCFVCLTVIRLRFFLYYHHVLIIMAGRHFLSNLT